MCGCDNLAGIVCGYHHDPLRLGDYDEEAMRAAGRPMPSPEREL